MLSQLIVPIQPLQVREAAHHARHAFFASGIAQCLARSEDFGAEPRVPIAPTPGA